MTYLVKILNVCFVFLFIISCTENPPQEIVKNTIKRNDVIINALEAVRDSMQLDDASFERIQNIVLKYEEETKRVQKEVFNNPKSKQQLVQNLMKSRRTELGDVLKAKETITFNRLYKQSLANERQRKKEEKRLSREEQQQLSVALKKYRTESVFPIVLEQRKALEVAMSATDKTQIAELRTKMKGFNERFTAKQNECKTKDKKILRTCRRELKDLRKEYELIEKEFKKLNDLLLTKSETKPLMQQMDKQRKEWRAGLKKIMSLHIDKEIVEDNIPMGKYLRLVQPTPFLMFDPNKVEAQN